MRKRVGGYQELREWVNVYMSGALDIMIIEGSAGAGKSSIVREELHKHGDKHYCWLEGRTSAAALYDKLYQNVDLPIILDDIDSLYRDKESVNLLKCLCQTWSKKTISWNTLAKRASGTPPSFETKSKICIITNSWKSLNKHVGAVEDRGLLILFHPDSHEVHRYVKEELGNRPEIYDDEIYQFIGSKLGIIKEPSVRYYRNSLQLKQVGSDWREVLIESFGLNDKEMLVMKLCQRPDLSHNQRSKIFAETLKLSERTYYRHLRELRNADIDMGEIAPEENAR